jgi:ABC-type Fe3+/spermidine/putrescine transport system ATPase subunit
MAAVELKGVTKQWGPVIAVEPTDLRIEDGEFVAILGPSGCGKSTTLLMLAGIYAPSAGEIRFDGALVNDVEARDRNVGIVFQSYALYPNMTAKDNIRFPLRFKKLPREDAERRARAMAKLVQVEELLQRRPAEMSGGQQQRVALARALAGTPKVVLLDEPFSGLDAALRARVRQEVREILVAAGVTALFVTHDQEEALSLADHVAVMRDGRIEQVGTPEEVYGRPASRWVAEFLGEADVLPGTVEDGWVECELARVPAEGVGSGEAEVLVRPESVALSIGPAAGGRTQVEGVVVEREFFGHDQLVHVELPSGRRLRSRSLSYPVWHPGDRVRVQLDGPVNVFATAAS